MSSGIAGGEAAPISVAYIASWAAISADTGEAARRFGECAEESIVPAALRRRLGAFARMAVTCGLSIADAETSDLVFCSRYGDVDLAYRLLSDLISGGLMSPAGFSLSVHNAIPGVMDLARKNRVGHTAIAAGSQSLSSGLTEAWGKLAASPDEKIALVFAEAPLPPVYAEKSETVEHGIALALTLSATKPEKICGALSLDLTGRVSTDALDTPSSEVLAGLLIGALDTPQPGHFISWRSRGANWTFHADEAGLNAAA